MTPEYDRPAHRDRSPTAEVLGIALVASGLLANLVTALAGLLAILAGK